MEARLRAETELRLLMTAAVTDKSDLREQILDFGYFTTPQAQRIQAAFIDVYLAQPTADYSVYFSALQRNEQLALVEMLNTAISQSIEEKTAEGVLANLKDKAIADNMRRRISELLISDDYTPDDLRKIADEAEAAPTSAADSRERYIRDYDAAIKTIPTGYALLDSLLRGGLAEGTVSSLGARPSVGKTAMAVNIAAANAGRKTLFFSLEMSSRMIYDKLVSGEMNIDYRECVSHNVNIETVKCALAKFDDLTVYDDIYDIETIAQIIRKVKPELVIIDYIQIVQTQENIEVPRQRIDYISRIIKRTAKQTKAHIMCLSQTTRAAKEKPTMSALKESGGLEETSDYILLLHRPYVLDKSDERYKPEDTELNIDKNKFGQTATLEYYFDGAYQKFTEIGFMSEKKQGHEHDEQIARMKKNERDDDGEDLPF